MSLSIKHSFLHILWDLDLRFKDDAVHVIVQPARQTKTAEMVRGAPRQAEEEDHTRTYNHCASQEA